MLRAYSTVNIPDYENICLVTTPAKIAKLADYLSTECELPQIIIYDPGFVWPITEATFAMAVVGKNSPASLLNNLAIFSSSYKATVSSIDELF